MAIECAEKIWIPGNSPSGNNLHARFTGAEQPDAVRVKGTDDQTNLRGSSGNWISRDKYTSIEVTLVLVKNGVDVKECTYGADGNLIDIPPPNEDVVVENFTLTNNGSGTVSATWTTSVENDADVFFLYRDDVAAGDTPAEGVGTNYRIDDPNAGTGTKAYVLTVTTFANPDEVEVAMSSITV